MDHALNINVVVGLIESEIKMSHERKQILKAQITKKKVQIIAQARGLRLIGISGFG